VLFFTILGIQARDQNKDRIREHMRRVPINEDGNEVIEDGSVYVLDDTNFDEFLSNYDFMLVRFFHPQSPHCKEIAPVYQGVAEVLLDQENPIPTALVDGSKNQELAKRFSVR
jgi:thiol-disulfide isomerase/thioredoxin